MKKKFSTIQFHATSSIVFSPNLYSIKSKIQRKKKLYPESVNGRERLNSAFFFPPKVSLSMCSIVNHSNDIHLKSIALKKKHRIVRSCCAQYRENLRIRMNKSKTTHLSRMMQTTIKAKHKITL